MSRRSPAPMAYQRTGGAMLTTSRSNSRAIDRLGVVVFANLQAKKTLRYRDTSFGFCKPNFRHDTST